jgi:hypothetical protein
VVENPDVAINRVERAIILFRVRRVARQHYFPVPVAATVLALTVSANAANLIIPSRGATVHLTYSKKMMLGSVTLGACTVRFAMAGSKKTLVIAGPIQEPVHWAMPAGGTSTDVTATGISGTFPCHLLYSSGT